MDKSHIIALFVGSIITLLGALVAHFFTERRDRRKEFNQAAINFRKAIVNEIIMLKGLPFAKQPFAAERNKTSTYEIIVRAYQRHHAAYLLFRERLSGVKKAGFDKAWNDYCYPNGQTSDLEPLLYYAQLEPKPGDSVPFDKTYIINRLETLISFAKIK